MFEYRIGVPKLYSTIALKTNYLAIGILLFVSIEFCCCYCCCAQLAAGYVGCLQRCPSCLNICPLFKQDNLIKQAKDHEADWHLETVNYKELSKSPVEVPQGWHYYFSTIIMWHQIGGQAPFPYLGIFCQILMICFFQFGNLDSALWPSVFSFSAKMVFAPKLEIRVPY